MTLGNWAIFRFYSTEDVSTEDSVGLQILHEYGSELSIPTLGDAQSQASPAGQVMLGGRTEGSPCS